MTGSAGTNEFSMGEARDRCRRRQGKRARGPASRSQSWHCVQTAWVAASCYRASSTRTGDPLTFPAGPRRLQTCQLLPRPTPALLGAARGLLLSPQGLLSLAHPSRVPPEVWSHSHVPSVPHTA